MKLRDEQLRKYLADHPHHKDIKHQIAAVVIGIFAFLSICAVGLVYYGMYTKDKISFGVKVAGISIGGMTYENALDKIQESKNPYLKQKITVQVNNENFSTTPSELGVDYEIQKAIDEAYGVGKQKNLFWRGVSLTESLISDIDFSLEIKHDEEKVDQFITMVTDEVNKYPQNASIKIEGVNLVDIPAIDGIGVDSKKLKKTILLNINHLNTQPIVGQVEVLKAEIQTENFAQAKEQAKNITNYNINLTFENQTYSITQAILMSWLDFPINGSNISATISDEKMRGYVNSIAKKIDIQAVDKKIADIDSAVLDEGKDGRALNRTALISTIKEILNSKNNVGQNTTVALQVNNVARGEKIVRQPFTPGLYPGKYIEVNVSTQTMYLWEGTNKIGEYQVSSGNVWSTPTPLGTRYVENKSSNAWSSKFKVYMPWWMSIGGGYGIHELPYYPDGRREGESYLGRAVSHGCIRLGIGAAESVYNWADIGTPVYIHKNS